MNKALLLLCLILSSAIFWHNSHAFDPAIEEEEIRARAYLHFLNEKAIERKRQLAHLNWNYAANITDENLRKLLEVSTKLAQESKDDWLETLNFNWKSYNDYHLHRQFEKYSIIGKAALPKEKFRKMNKIINDMKGIYRTAMICDYKNGTKCDLSLEPEINDIFMKSRDPDELKHVWIEWRRKTARDGRTKELYKDYVVLSNEAARLNNFTNNTEFWLNSYGMPNFKQQTQKLWKQLRPLYLQIHAYVRTKLRALYGDIVSEKGPIPSHLLGTMWSHSWSNIIDFTLPRPDAHRINITENMIKQNYTPIKLFRLADDFFISLNLSAMTPTFWNNSILIKPENGEQLNCHPSAWNFYDGEDFRIIQCARVEDKSLITAHHEMGHIQYFMQYLNQSIVYQEAANPGFYEAIGDVIGLSVLSTKHLKKINLIDPEEPDDYDSDLNNIFKIALDKIVLLPFAYLMDLWRWEVFEGQIKPEQYNCKWWEYRNNIQGVEAPVDRNEDNFDPAAKYHILADVPYLSYFVSCVIQFQFHRAACEIAGEYDPGDPAKPLYKCDIYQSTAAGHAIRKMLQLGSSRPWPEAMEVLTGQREIDSSGLLDYFRPLQKWLEAKNRKNKAFIGWESSKKKCTQLA